MDLPPPSVDLNPVVEVLDNGMTVIVVEDHRAPLVALSLRYRVGASEDRPGHTGKAHLFEHLMFEGTPAVPMGQYDALLAEAGATNNAWTDHDYTTYQVQAPPGALERALYLEADRLAHLDEGLAPAELANQQDVVLNERLMDEVGDGTYPLYALDWVLWGQDHPYAWPVLGTREDVRSTERPELVAFFDTYYRPSNAILCVVGDVSTDETLELVRRYFGAMASGPAPKRAEAPAPLPGQGETRWLMPEEIDDESLYIAWTTVPHGHADEPALDVAAMLLSGGRGTLLDDALYYKRNLATDNGAWTDNGRLGGDMVVWATRDDRRLNPMLRQIDRGIATLQREPPTDAELQRAVAQWRAELLRSLEDPEVLADTLGECWETWGEADCIAREIGRYEAVTPADVQRVAQQWLGADRVVLSVVSPDDERWAIRRSMDVYPP